MKNKIRKKRPYIGFIAPGFIMYTVFIIVPIFFAMFISLHEWSGLGEMKFTGLENFRVLLTDSRISPTFFHALKNNIKYMVVVLVIITPIQFGLAYLLYIKIKGHKYYRFMLFLPYVISTTIVSFFATILFDPNIGFMNKMLTSVGLEKSSWFGNPKLAFTLMVIVIMWQGIGTGMMIFYANMQDIPDSVIEASMIDGCNDWQRLYKIVIPLSIPSCATNIIMSTIWALGIFDLPYILGGATGGVNNSLDFVNMVFYRYTFGSALNGQSNMGFGSAISVVMFFIIFTVSMIQNRLLSKVEYEY
ncbi:MULTISPECIES: carbohydrate ABC transporter permease [Robinsoniella]|nr:MULTISPECIES: sugar ABC transporter permease [Robinsoniella]MDU7028616.1 sugar ABC transporter permease [Clostridiales bacterium]